MQISVRDYASYTKELDGFFEQFLNRNNVPRLCEIQPFSAALSSFIYKRFSYMAHFHFPNALGKGEEKGVQGSADQCKMRI